MLTLKSLEECSQKDVRCHTRKKMASEFVKDYLYTMFVTISLQELNLSMCINIFVLFHHLGTYSF